MKKLAWLIFLMAFHLSAQLHEVGFSVGGANMITDLGSDSYIKPDGFFASILYRRNMNEWISFRLSFSYSHTEESDLSAESLGRRLRGWRSDVNALGGDFMIEYNFLPLNPYRYPEKIWITPYLGLGVGAIHSTYTIYQNPATPLPGTLTAFTIPMTFGFKFSFRNRMKFIWEISPRYVWSDNLEGSLSLDPGPFPVTDKLGNDWMLFSGLSLTFGWGKLPCYLNVF